MKRYLKIAGIVLTILLVIVVILALKADDYIEGRIAEKIKNVPNTILIDYEDMEFDTFKGNLIFKNTSVSFKDKDLDTIISSITIKDIAILDIDYWDYISEGKIKVDRLEILNPQLVHLQKRVQSDSIKSSDSSNVSTNFGKHLHINSLEISNASVEIRDFDNDTLLTSTMDTNIVVKDVLIDSTVGDLLPFKYKDYKVELNQFYHKLGDYEGLYISSANLVENEISLIKASIKTKYDRIAYDKMLKVERDWYNIEVDSLRMKQSRFGKANDSINMFVSDTTFVYNPVVEIYRNKLNPDERKIKPFYSEMLRNLNFDLSLNTILLENGFVSYEEKVIQGHNPGKLEFSEFYATIENFSNTYEPDQQTRLTIKTNFMETTPLNVKWNFDQNNTSDAYTFEGELGSIDTNVLNQFTNNNLNILLEGVIHKIYFNIDGNNNNSTINLSINYDDFRIKLINDKKNKPKKILNAIVNIFVKKDSESEDGNFRDAQETIDRNKYGSFYNNLWLNIEAGLKKAIL